MIQPDDNAALSLLAVGDVPSLKTNSATAIIRHHFLRDDKECGTAQRAPFVHSARVCGAVYTVHTWVPQTRALSHRVMSKCLSSSETCLSNPFGPNRFSQTSSTSSVSGHFGCVSRDVPSMQQCPQHEQTETLIFAARSFVIVGR